MGVMLDCPDAKALSHFYAELLGKPVTYEADGVAMIGEEGAQPVMFQQVEQYTAPRWPDPAYPQQIHLDVTVQEVDAAERAALDIGATHGRRLPELARLGRSGTASPSSTSGVDGRGGLCARAFGGVGRLRLAPHGHAELGQDGGDAGGLTVRGDTTSRCAISAFESRSRPAAGSPAGDR